MESTEGRPTTNYFNNFTCNELYGNIFDNDFSGEEYVLLLRQEEAYGEGLSKEGTEPYSESSTSDERWR